MRNTHITSPGSVVAVVGLWLSLFACTFLAHEANANVADDCASARPWMNKTLPIRERAQALLACMTVDERIAMTFATHTHSSTAKQFIKTGVGAVKFLSAFSCGSNVTDCVVQRNELQKAFVEQSRLGIPASFINEGLHGGAPTGTIFPMPISQAMSWNVSLVSNIARVIGLEASAIGVDTVFAPVVNMMPDPRFGRLQEGFGENPVVTSIFASSSVEALQAGARNASSGYLPPGAVASLTKHYAAYGAAMGGLNGGPADVTNLTLHEVYLRPWLAIARQGSRSVMPSHNSVNDIPAHGNQWLIDQTLRQRFGFGDGIALSDCDDIGVMVDFRFAANVSHAAALALRAGVDWDLQCGGESEWSYNHLNESLAEGLVDEATLNDTVLRVLIQKFSSNLFDDPYASTANVSQLDQPSRRSLAREAAEQGTVLLVNANNTLPMPLDGKRVAVFGPLAMDSSATVGSYVLGGASVVTVEQAISAAVGSSGNTTFMAGCDNIQGPPTQSCPQLNDAIDLAKQSDVAVLVLGDSNGNCGEWSDRDNLDLAGDQLYLLGSLAGVAPKTIVILVHGRPQTFGLSNAVLKRVDAMFAAWRPGEEGGTAIVNLITGKANPSAKLAQSWPRTVGHVLSGSAPWLQRVRGKWVSNNKGCGSLKSDGRCYDPYVYDGYDNTPLFPFGFGLSYTNFFYDALSVSVAEPRDKVLARRITNTDVQAQVFCTVNVTIHNKGSVSGAESFQVYVEDPAGLPFVPFWRRLVGFGRVLLQPGERQSVLVPILWRDFAMFGPDMELRVFPGEYKFMAGASSDDISLSSSVVI